MKPFCSKKMGARVSAVMAAMAFTAVLGMMFVGCAPQEQSNSADSSSAVEPVEASSSSAKADAGDISVTVVLTEDVTKALDVDTPLQFSDETTTVSVAPGSSALDALKATGREIHTDDGLPEQVVAIGGLENGAAGADSHWEMQVNGTAVSESPASYTVADGDTVTWTFVH